MADNVAITAGSGTTVATDQNPAGSNEHYQIVKIAHGALDTFNLTDTASGKPLPVQLRGSAGGDVIKLEDDASANADPGIVILTKRAATPGNTSGTDGDYEPLQVDGGKLWVHPVGDFVTVATDVTRPADTTAYAANDAWSDSTTAPTSGGFTFTGAARISGGSGIITDAVITTSADPATTLQGEVWLFDTSVTNINDNAAFAVTDTEIKTYVGKIPFTLEDAGNNGAAHVQNLSIGFTCVGSANLRFLVKVKNAYTPGSAEVLTVRLKIIQTN
jgi:hypothetical protein